MDLSSFRIDYTKSVLNERDAGSEPFHLFGAWLDEAVREEVVEPTAMVLSTVSSSGMPSSRIVLLKGITDGQLVFYSNYNSRKGRHLSSNPSASLLFFWGELERQVRFEGKVIRLPEAVSDEYFNTRPYESRIGALVSQQSMVIPGREELESHYRLLYEQMKDRQDVVRRPANWGGYAFEPRTVEFWQGRSNRLHDRIRFRLIEGEWLKERLAP
ncbi:MAG TPA: pyridoxamine 5'-phosphate oxidase [Lentimicrobium sp.]|jgi:pyridoxamine-phosphate oxidase|nr:pyridoxamine 5'-phosphate oxidase [Lentimicrobium sp.]